MGCFSVVGADEEEAARVASQLKILIRPMYSNPPLYGARVVHAVLSDDALKAQWYGECKGMADRIIAMRTALRGHLEALGGGASWNHARRNTFPTRKTPGISQPFPERILIVASFSFSSLAHGR